MVEFMKKIMDWILEKEADMARGSHINPEDIDKQIEIIEKKRESLSEEDNADEIFELGHMLDKLHFIKAESIEYKEQ